MNENGRWRALPENELWIADQVQQIMPKSYVVSRDTTAFENQELTFYDSGYLLRVKDPTWGSNQEALFFIYLKDRDLFRLNGVARPIYAANEMAPLRLDEGNVLDYLRFFCRFIEAEEGRFLIVENVDGPGMPKDLDDQTRAAFKEFIRPAAYQRKNEQGHFVCRANVLYDKQLTLCDFIIDSRTGSVEIG